MLTCVLRIGLQDFFTEELIIIEKIGEDETGGLLGLIEVGVLK